MANGQWSMANGQCYRRASGENQEPAARLALLVLTALKEGQVAQAQQFLAEYLGEIDEPWAKVLIPKLQAILNGERTPALADDPALDYDDAAELRLLLEGVGS